MEREGAGGNKKEHRGSRRIRRRRDFCLRRISISLGHACSVDITEEKSGRKVVAMEYYYITGNFIQLFATAKVSFNKWKDSPGGVASFSFYKKQSVHHEIRSCIRFWCCLFGHFISCITQRYEGFNFSHCRGQANEDLITIWTVRLSFIPFLGVIFLSFGFPMSLFRGSSSSSSS